MKIRSSYVSVCFLPDAFFILKCTYCLRSISFLMWFSYTQYASRSQCVKTAAAEVKGEIPSRQRVSSVSLVVVLIIHFNKLTVSWCRMNKQMFLLPRTKIVWLVKSFLRYHIYVLISLHRINSNKSHDGYKVLFYKLIYKFI